MTCGQWCINLMKWKVRSSTTNKEKAKFAKLTQCARDSSHNRSEDLENRRTEGANHSGAMMLRTVMGTAASQNRAMCHLEPGEISTTFMPK